MTTIVSPPALPPLTMSHRYLGTPSTADDHHFLPTPQSSSQPFYSRQDYPLAGPSTQRTPSTVNTGVNLVTPERSRERDEGDGRVGVEDPFGERSYTELKCLGDGSFGTVWLCDWQSPVKPDTYLSAMQCGAGARPEWAGKRLVALKRMKRVWDGGWKQASSLGEIVSLRRIPPHPAIIPLYDAFISPASRELYFVFECMEGNLYQLTKSRRGRPLAAGLIASCFHQISTGLHHIHRHGFFHRDMKPENLLVTTTGLADYLNADTLNAINSGEEPHEMRYEKDVSVIVKLADFGLARATHSKPPYTEYVSTRWYRAPEVLLRSTEYGPPVDMWALGTILAEMLNLKPLFPGVSEIDQVYRICETMGDPSSDYGVDERGGPIGGGSWNSGIKLAKAVGFSFPKRKPANFRALFHASVPQSLVDCISDLLRYNPKYRMTAAQCIEHPYFHETLPHLQRTPPLPRIPFSSGQPPPGAMPQVRMDPVPPRSLPPSHAHQKESRPFANGDMRTLPPPVGTPDSSASRVFFPHSSPIRDGASALVNQLRELDLPTEDLASYGHRPPPSAGRQQWTERQPYDSSVYDSSNPSLSQFNLSVSNLQLSERRRKSSSVAQYIQQLPMDGPVEPPPIEPTPNAAPNKLTMGKKKKWGLSSVFGGGDKELPPVDELSPVSAPVTYTDPKKAKKEAARLADEQARIKREAVALQAKERSRAVLQKRTALVEAREKTKTKGDIEFNAMNVVPDAVMLTSSPFAPRHPMQSVESVRSLDSSRSGLSTQALAAYDRTHSRHKARRRDDDDDHSMSSYDVGKSVSAATFATVDSE
ncbi:kinase-like domain-containing protein [Naematelia encephala]|uniref:Kinase-like domain-containing protein n=1 Tax=Naematelia encephala TaxID=71784 RepID=A0A1Y2BHK6_9TREE|nr:kinase-like domain-containing protein [Naematelia encephala]